MANQESAREFASHIENNAREAVHSSKAYSKLQYEAYDLKHDVSGKERAEVKQIINQDDHSKKLMAEGFPSITIEKNGDFFVSGTADHNKEIYGYELPPVAAPPQISEQPVKAGPGNQPTPTGIELPTQMERTKLV